MDYINAHGTGTVLGDIAETRGIKLVLNSHAHKLAISSTKSATGHLLGASGGVELIAVARALTEGVVPPTLNLDQPEEECDLDFVPNTPRQVQINTALSSSFGFGGHNACLLLRRLD